jgi:hypothetical protein
MALPATEAFTGTAAALAGSWTQTFSGFGGTLNRNGSGVAIPAGGVGAGAARWNADTFNASQYAQVEFRSAAMGEFVEPIVRAAGADGTFGGYGHFSGPSGSGIEKYVNAAVTNLASFGATPTAGDIIRVTVSGRVVAAYRNGIYVGQASDTSLTTGAGGLVLSGTTNTADNWEAGNILPPGGSPLSITMIARRRAAFW